MYLGISWAVIVFGYWLGYYFIWVLVGLLLYLGAGWAVIVFGYWLGLLLGLSTVAGLSVEKEHMAALDMRPCYYGNEMPGQFGYVCACVGMSVCLCFCLFLCDCMCMYVLLCLSPCV